MIDIFRNLPFNHPGLFLSCHELADANDIVECLRYSEREFTRVGYTGFWLSDESILDHLMNELPNLRIHLS